MVSGRGRGDGQTLKRESKTSAAIFVARPQRSARGKDDMQAWPESRGDAGDEPDRTIESESCFPARVARLKLSILCSSTRLHRQRGQHPSKPPSPRLTQQRSISRCTSLLETSRLAPRQLSPLTDDRPSRLMVEELSLTRESQNPSVQASMRRM